MTTWGPGPRTRVRRLPEKANYDEAVIGDIFDQAPYCYLAGLSDGVPVALPTLHARQGRQIYLHASRSNAVFRSVLTSRYASVTATLYDGIRVARSGFESSMAYRSAVAMGPVSAIDDNDEKRRILTLMIDSALPGRSLEVRPMREREIALTTVVVLDIKEASAKISRGPTADEPDDLALPVWSGVIPVREVFGEPVPSTDGAMASGNVELPPSIQRLYS